MYTHTHTLSRLGLAWYCRPWGIVYLFYFWKSLAADLGVCRMQGASFGSVHFGTAAFAHFLPREQLGACIHLLTHRRWARKGPSWAGWCRPGQGGCRPRRRRQLGRSVACFCFSWKTKGPAWLYRVYCITHANRTCTKRTYFLDHYDSTDAPQGEKNVYMWGRLKASNARRTSLTQAGEGVDPL